MVAALGWGPASGLKVWRKEYKEERGRGEVGKLVGDKRNEVRVGNDARVELKEKRGRGR